MKYYKINWIAAPIFIGSQRQVTWLFSYLKNHMYIENKYSFFVFASEAWQSSLLRAKQSLCLNFLSIFLFFIILMKDYK